MKSDNKWLWALAWDMQKLKIGLQVPVQKSLAWLWSEKKITGGPYLSGSPSKVISAQSALYVYQIKPFYLPHCLIKHCHGASYAKWTYVCCTGMGQDGVDLGGGGLAQRPCSTTLLGLALRMQPRHVALEAQRMGLICLAAEFKRVYIKLSMSSCRVTSGSLDKNS